MHLDPGKSKEVEILFRSVRVVAGDNEQAIVAEGVWVPAQRVVTIALALDEQVAPIG